MEKKQTKASSRRELALLSQLLQNTLMNSANLNLEHMQQVLEGLQDVQPSSDFDLNHDMRPVGMKFRPAAVLVPIIERGDQVNLVLTKRSAALKHHPGQISFPGGKVDASDDSPVAAALREAREEIGLSGKHVELLGSLPNHETVTGFDVHPFVARIASTFRAVPEAGEVEEVFEVPLAHVLNPQNYLIEGRVWMGQQRWYYVAPYGPYYIWGATARMLRMLADRMADFDAD